MILILIVILHTLQYVTSKTCVLNHSPVEDTWEKKLHSFLQCPTYNFEPPNTSNETQVTVRLVLRNLNFDSKEEVFTVFYWAQMIWIDERLKWDPNDFGNITTTVRMSSKIWIPGLKLINNPITDDLETFYFTPCSIKSTGEIRYVPRIVDASICNTKLRNWPYDIQRCQLQFGAWQRGSTKVIFHLKNPKVGTNPVDIGRWLLKSYKQEDVKINDTQILLTFVLERQAASLAAIVIYPASILAMLTITTLFLDVRSNTRMGLSIFNLANHFSYLSALQALIPAHTADSPSLIMYYRGSLILTILVFLLTLIFKWLCSKVNKNILIETFTGSVSDRSIKYAVLWWDCEEGNNKIWIDFASVLNSISLYALITTYFSMYLVLVPAPEHDKVENFIV